jgi:hypothetical protein
MVDGPKSEVLATARSERKCKKVKMRSVAGRRRVDDQKKPRKGIEDEEDD